MRQGNGVARAVAAAEAASAGAAPPAARSPSLSAAEAGQEASPRHRAVLRAGSGFATPPPGGAPWAKGLRASSKAAEPDEAAAPEEAPSAEAASAPLGARSGRVAAAVAAAAAASAAAAGGGGELRRRTASLEREAARPAVREVRDTRSAGRSAPCTQPLHLAPGLCEPMPSPPLTAGGCQGSAVTWLSPRHRWAARARSTGGRGRVRGRRQTPTLTLLHQAAKQARAARAGGRGRVCGRRAAARERVAARAGVAAAALGRVRAQSRRGRRAAPRAARGGGARGARPCGRAASRAGAARVAGRAGHARSVRTRVWCAARRMRGRSPERCRRVGLG
jgi:hypothetical protein